MVVPDDARYSGHLERGITVVNGLAQRGRRLGLDVFLEAREQVPLDLVGMASEELGGLGEVPPPELARTMAAYRFYFHPVRYTSLGLSLCEAMTVGLPVVGLATTELPTVIDRRGGRLRRHRPAPPASTPCRRCSPTRGLARRVG